ncbi:hypothetical protein PROFUN_11207 [Planoprotostelium fungivorum]|uniref:Uncharacterized protein n=1 Tax=Planoprotostelium fungivorum TaxID=1890364 RepID=A0A2P6NAX9_9EUKA|nr:hypothetical protein PROFUN_11207 [Planoprotostelium fungivorum]
MAWPEEQVPQIDTPRESLALRERSDHPNMGEKEIMCAEMLLSLREPAHVESTTQNNNIIETATTILHTIPNQATPNTSPIKQIPTSPARHNNSVFHHQHLVLQGVPPIPFKSRRRMKRNTNPCPEHRRKHQRCPETCPSRLKGCKEVFAMADGAHDGMESESAPSSPVKAETDSYHSSSSEQPAPLPLQSM